MPRLDRYIAAQLLALFGFFSLVLVAVYWVNRAVGLFDQLIGDGQSALVFVEFSLLSLPNVIRLVLPVSAFAACLYVVNRMSMEAELVVLQATGLSPARLARPVILFGIVVMVMQFALANVIVPLSQGRLAVRSAEVSESITARFLTPGRFVHPAEGVTVYIREISPVGELNGLFLSDERQPGERRVYTARQALIVRSAGTPRLVMLDGMVQRLVHDAQGAVAPRLGLTRFADFSLDLAGIVGGAGARRPGPKELPTAELLRADAQTQERTGYARAALLEEGHSRIAGPLLGLAAPLLGLAALLQGGWTRFGLWRQIALAVVLLILLQLVSTAGSAAALKSDTAWPLSYAAPLAGLAVSAGLLWLAGRPKRRSAAGAAVAGGAA